MTKKSNLKDEQELTSKDTLTPLTPEEEDKLMLNEPLPQTFGIVKEKAWGLMAQHIEDKKYIKFAKEYIKVQPVYYDASKLWWLWDYPNWKWKIVDEVDILNSIHLLSGEEEIDTSSSGIKARSLEALRQVGRANGPKPLPKKWIQFKNKFVDLETGKIMRVTPKYLATNPIPWDIGECEFTPNIDKCFMDWVGEEKADALMQAVAYSLLPDYPIHRLFCFVGAGNNGKTTFLNLLGKFIGKENTCSTDLDILLDSRFEISALYKKLVCIMGETNFSALKKTSLLKRLTGRDMIRFEFKGNTPFQEYNYAKIFIATNTLPATTDKTRGFYRRWLLFDFKNEFTGTQDILEEIPDYEYQNLARKCIRILQDLLTTNEFRNKETIEEMADRYELMSNPVVAFINKFCKKDKIGKILFSEFSEGVKAYLKDTGKREMNDNEISRTLTNEGYQKDRQGKFKYTWIFGLSWGRRDYTSPDFENTDVAACMTSSSAPLPNTIYTSTTTTTNSNNDVIDVASPLKFDKIITPETRQKDVIDAATAHHNDVEKLVRIKFLEDFGGQAINSDNSGNQSNFSNQSDNGGCRPTFNQNEELDVTYEQLVELLRVGAKIQIISEK